MGDYKCHAVGCQVRVSPDKFMCGEHWYLLPAELRRRVVRFYRKVEPFLEEPSSLEWTLLEKEAQEAVEQKLFERCIQNHGSACKCWNKQPAEIP